jgi:hypothetical protein
MTDLQRVDELLEEYKELTAETAEKELSLKALDIYLADLTNERVRVTQDIRELGMLLRSLRKVLSEYGYEV